MLDPEYLLRISEGGEQIAQEMAEDILERIVERIAIRLARGDDYKLTAIDKWQIQVLQDAGYLLEDVQNIIAERTGIMIEEIAAAFEDAGVKSISYDNAIYEAAGLSPQPIEKSPALIRLMQRTFEKTVGEWKNFTGTIAEAVQKTFISACDRAYTQVTSGSLSYTQAYMEALETVVTDGVKVRYPSGHEDTIETATLRCIRTGASQATAEITMARMEEMNWDIILVSSHLGARVTGKEDFTNHYWWQGKFYSKSGQDKRFPPFSVCGFGHVQGIHGANCRHHIGPGDGEHNPFREFDSKENQKAYELSQKQRAMERQIRKSKEEVMGLRKGVEAAEDPEAKAEAEEKYQKAAALLQDRNKAYNDFCEENNLKKLNERLKIAQWDREEAAKARGAARKYKNSLENAKNNDKIEKKIGLQFFANKGIQKMNDHHIEKSINSWEENIEKHRKKIDSPAAFDAGWENKTNRQKEGLINHWKKEIQTMQNNITQAQEELRKRRGDNGQ